MLKAFLLQVLVLRVNNHQNLCAKVLFYIIKYMRIRKGIHSCGVPKRSVPQQNVEINIIMSKTRIAPQLVE